MDMTVYISSIVAVFVISAVLFFWFGIVFRKKTAESKIATAEQQANKIIDEAKRIAENSKKESELQIKEQVLKYQSEVDEEIKQRKRELKDEEARLNQRQELCDKRTITLEEKENNVNKRQEELNILKENLKNAEQKQIEELSRIARMSIEDAKKLLLEKVSNEVRNEMAEIIREAEQKAKDDSNKIARTYIAQAIQRCAADHTSEMTVTTVNLPNDDMKGRIIGREGRNIRTIETLTGIDLIIDDTPDVIILSSFDPIRREVARIALERLISDGRIHPAKIEEMIEKAKQEIENTIKEEGERAVYETGVNVLAPDLVKLLGKLKYRTSYGQNVLNHSIEVSYIAGLLADEIGIDSKLARRAGLLHDIGKSVDHEVEGTHPEIGTELVKRYKESEEVINAVAAHHGDVEPTSITAILVQAADAISASRPGARRETFEAYVKRLQKLEEISNSFKGVDKSYAIQAGREVRIIVKPEEIDDANAVIMARDIAKRIEQEMNYPGQIRVHVIRETRATELAK